MTACTYCGRHEGDPKGDVLVVTASIKGRDVEVSRQGSEDWYIRVWEADGTYAYDGYWHDSSAKTADEVIAEARSGACVDEEDL